MPISAEDAVAAVAPDYADHNVELRASRVGGTELWSVAAIDSSGFVVPGAMTVVGPDRRVWRFSSNWGIHDSDLVTSTLVALYGAGVEGLVEPDALAARIQALTEERNQQVREIVRDARAGELRTAPPRRLP